MIILVYTYIILVYTYTRIIVLTVQVIESSFAFTGTPRKLAGYFSGAVDGKS